LRVGDRAKSRVRALHFLPVAVAVAVAEQRLPKGHEPPRGARLTTQPVALLLCEGLRTLNAASVAGFRYFIAVEAFKQYVELEVLGEVEAAQRPGCLPPPHDDTLALIAEVPLAYAPRYDTFVASHVMDELIYRPVNSAGEG
jgi:hypothetical protein